MTMVVGSLLQEVGAAHLADCLQFFSSAQLEERNSVSFFPPRQPVLTVPPARAPLLNACTGGVGVLGPM